MKKEGHHLYWAHHKTKHTDMQTQGYIGITKDLSIRIREHRNNKELGKFRNYLRKYSSSVIFELIQTFDTRKEASDAERLMRPHEGIGLNTAPGGDNGTGLMKPSDETKKKLSIASQNMSDETKQKLREANLGKKMSPEAIEKTRQANLGRKRTPEQNKRNSESQKGIKHTKEAKKKMSDAKKGKPGPKHTEETKRKIGASNKATYYRKHPPPCATKVILLQV